MENEETEPSIQSADLRMLRHCLHFVHTFLGSASLNITIENHYHEPNSELRKHTVTPNQPIIIQVGDAKINLNSGGNIIGNTIKYGNE